MRRLVVTFALCLSPGACSSAPAVGDAPLAGGLTSLDALGQAVVAGLNSGDPRALTALALDEDEYTGRLFPALASAPTAERVGRDVLWDMHARQSRDDLQRAIALYGRGALEFVRFEPRRQVRRAGVVFHERPRVVVRDPGGGERRLQILASVVEHEASHTFKLLGYRDHE